MMFLLYLDLSSLSPFVRFLPWFQSGRLLVYGVVPYFVGDLLISIFPKRRSLVKDDFFFIRMDEGLYMHVF